MTETITALIGLDPTVWAGLSNVGLLLTLLGMGAMGTVLASNVKQGDTSLVFDLIATATAGQSLTRAHNLGTIAAVAGSPFAALAPQVCIVTPTTRPGSVSQWIASVNTTNVVLTKLSVANSASSVPQARVVVMLPHSLIR